MSDEPKTIGEALDMIADLRAVRDDLLNQIKNVTEEREQQIERAGRNADRADTVQALFATHTTAVADFLNELYMLFCDPLASVTLEVSEVRAALLNAGNHYRNDTPRLDLAEICYIHNPPSKGGDWGVVRPGAETAFGPTLREALDKALRQ